MKPLHFRAHNLVATIVAPDFRWPPDLRTGTCPLTSGCGPPTNIYACFYSVLFPRSADLTPEDLRATLRELRQKLDVEKRGLDLVIKPLTEREAPAYTAILESEGLTSEAVGEAS